MIGKGLFKKDKTNENNSGYFRDNWNCLDFFVVLTGWWGKLNS